MAGHDYGRMKDWFLKKIVVKINISRHFLIRLEYVFRYR